MIVKKYIIIFSLFTLLNCQNETSSTTLNSNQTDTNETAQDPAAQQMALIQQYKDICMPIPIGFTLLSEYQDDCRKLQMYPNDEYKFKCCRIEYQEKNKPQTRKNGCMGIIPSYINNNRYEDWIDYIKRGKLEKIQAYSIFLGPTNAQYFQNFLRNRTKHEVFKFDCLSSFIKNKIYALFLLVGLFL